MGYCILTKLNFDVENYQSVINQIVHTLYYSKHFIMTKCTWTVLLQHYNIVHFI